MSHETNYVPCPCGRGKKVKHCCGRPVVAELEKIIRALAGDQRAAALNLTRTALKKTPDNPALLSLQCQLELEQEESDQSTETVDHLQRLLPDSPVAFAFHAVRAVQNKQVETAVEHLQDALEATSNSMCELVYHALGAVAQALWYEQHFLGGMAHAALFEDVTPEEQRMSQDLSLRMAQSPRRLISLRYVRPLREPAEEAPWGPVAEQALNDAAQGRWRKAARQLEAQHADGTFDADLIYNLAVLRMHLGQDEQAARWLREFSRQPDLSRLEVVEAEALAQRLFTAEGSAIDQVRLVYEVEPLDAVMERLLADRRLASSQVDTQQFTDANMPPPRAAFRILDRDEVRTAAELESSRDMPRSLGQLLVFGKQTDRPARLEILTYREEQHLPVCQAVLEELGGNETRLLSEEVLGQSDSLRVALSWNPVLPDDMPLDRHSELLQEKQREVLNETWPHVPMPALQGKTPTEAAGDPELQIPLLAAVQNLEIETLQSQIKFDFRGLRERLQLPEREPVTAPFGDPIELPLERIFWLETTELDDQELFVLFGRCFQAHFAQGVERLVAEMERREDRDFGTHLALEHVHEFLATEAPDSETALHHLSKAQQYLEAKGKSPAEVMLAAIPHHLLTGNAQEVASLMTTLQNRHIREPGIAEGLYQLIQTLQASQGVPQAGPGAPAAGASAEAGAGAGKLWTPGGDSAGPAEKEKPKLWMPGMD